MKKILVILFLGLSFSILTAQDSQAALKVSISRDSILLGNTFELTFTLKNGNGARLPMPSFKDFDIVMGPSTMTSTTVINGDVSSSKSMSYVLRPIEVGQYFIEPISVEVDGQYLETSPMEINVYPNPEGIIQETQKRSDHSFEFFFSNPFEELKDFDLQLPKSIPLPREDMKNRKKKRKTTRL